MKLKDRKRVAFTNIKEEDNKPFLTKIESSTTFTAPDTDIIDLTIKQEDTKEDKVLLQPR
ncbi:hypothetical protein MBANPS3_010930, partial [Mucor bainieri]